MLDISTLNRCIRSTLGALRVRHTERARIGRELGDSSDRALAELGIARGDITTITHGRYRKA